MWILTLTVAMPLLSSTILPSDRSVSKLMRYVYSQLLIKLPRPPALVQQRPKFLEILHSGLIPDILHRGYSPGAGVPGHWSGTRIVPFIRRDPRFDAFSLERAGQPRLPPRQSLPTGDHNLLRGHQQRPGIGMGGQISLLIPVPCGSGEVFDAHPSGCNLGV